jgi:predicted Rossmann fold nucleotide-binding protein DprA/Smf involved in DNA uptake
MKIAIVGSRSLNAEIPDNCIPENVTEIISGAAKGIDTSARHFARKHHIFLTDILPEYDLYGKRAPLIRNDLIISMSDKVFIFWDGKSHGTGYIIKKCKEIGKPYVLYIYKENRFSLLEQYTAE